MFATPDLPSLSNCLISLFLWKLMSSNNCCKGVWGLNRAPAAWAKDILGVGCWIITRNPQSNQNKISNWLLCNWSFRETGRQNENVEKDVSKDVVLMSRFVSFLRFQQIRSPHFVSIVFKRFIKFFQTFFVYLVEILL